MEVRKGYKQTEIGLIPEDWETKPLKDISPSQSVGLVINPSTYFDDNGTIPMLVGSNIGENHINWTSAQRITTEGNKLIPASQLRANDLVTVRVGEPGTTAVVPPELDGCNCASMMIVRQHRSFNSHWLCYVMNSQIGLRQIKNVQYGTAQKQFNISDAINFIYPFPSLPEQEAIAEALSDADALIEAVEQLLTKKRQVKQGAMSELLTGKRRLSGFGGEWETKKLGEITEIISGGTPSTRIDEYWNGNINWCTPTDITGTSGKYLDSTEKQITELGLKNSSANLLPKGTLLLCTRATIGEVKIATDVICTNQGFKSLICSNQVNNEFLYYVLLTLKPKLIEKAIGSTFLEITKKQTALIEIRMPSIAEQTAIAEILSDMDAEISALEEKLVKARQVKAGMMSELLTGKIRLV